MKSTWRRHSGMLSSLFESVVGARSLVKTATAPLLPPDGCGMWSRASYSPCRRRAGRARKEGGAAEKRSLGPEDQDGRAGLRGRRIYFIDLGEGFITSLSFTALCGPTFPLALDTENGRRPEEVPASANRGRKPHCKKLLFGPDRLGSQMFFRCQFRIPGVQNYW
jgi:hypothetical protein